MVRYGEDAGRRARRVGRAVRAASEPVHGGRRKGMLHHHRHHRGSWSFGFARRGWVRAAVVALVAPAALAGTLSHRAAAAPIPIQDLVEGFSPTFQYELSPDGRYLFRRDLRGTGSVGT